MNKTLSIFLLVALFLYCSCNTETYTQGKRLYTSQCANCHMEDGTGLAKLIPPLAKSDYLKNNQSKIPCIILHGQKGRILVNGVEYEQEMPAQQYSEVQITNIINYINTSWGNDSPPVSLKIVKESLSNCNMD